MITNSVLKSIFRLRRNFAPGHRPPHRSFDDVEITAFRGGAKASATISADFELGWAFRGSNGEERLQRCARCRRNVPHLVRLLEEAGVQITWATVGHLFLERCEPGSSGLAHPDMPRPPKNLRWEGDWYVHDPCTDFKADPYWYAPDLIQLIRSSSVKHEIGSHSFSHIDFSKSTSTLELIQEELERCISVMALHELKLRSLVYPFNNMGHHYLDLIGRLGLTAVRHRDPIVRLSYPERTPSGVYKLCESMNLRRASRYDYIEKARIFLDEACKREAAYHLWFHPSDPTEVFEREFHGIIQCLADLQRQGKVWVATMGQLAAYCEAREQTTLEIERRGQDLTVGLRCKYDVNRYGQTALTLRITSNSIPKECRVQAEGASRLVDWKNGQMNGKTDGARSFLVDVPITTSELQVLF